MNRDFFIPDISPAQARKILLARPIYNVDISPEVEVLARQDRLQLSDFDSALGLDQKGLEICQFINDFNHRCVIPFEANRQQAFRAMTAMLPRDRKILFLVRDPFIWIKHTKEALTKFHPDNEHRFQYAELSEITPMGMVQVRNWFVVANIRVDDYGYEWLGRVFPEMIIYCHHRTQQTLPYNSRYTDDARHAAGILYPRVVQSMLFGGKSNSRLTKDAALPVMGCYNGLLGA